MKAKVYEFESLGSTNTYAKTNIDQFNNFDVIHALNQTDGHGRMARQWISNNDSLTFSIVIKDEYILERFDSLSLITAVSVYKVLSKYLKMVSIKWPNDILVGNKKICGILLEGKSSIKLDAIIIGIGVNINNQYLEDSVRIERTSMYLETNKKYDIRLIRDAIVSTLQFELNLLKDNNLSYLEIMNSNNYLFNKEAYASIDNKEIKVKIGKILSNNKIQVFVDGKERELSTGEISFHKKTESE